MLPQLYVKRNKNGKIFYHWEGPVSPSSDVKRRVNKLMCMLNNLNAVDRFKNTDNGINIDTTYTVGKIKNLSDVLKYIEVIPHNDRSNLTKICEDIINGGDVTDDHS